MYGITAWPQSNIMGGGGYVDLTGEKNKPIEKEKHYSSTNDHVDTEKFSSLQELIDFYKTKYPTVKNHTGPIQYKYKGEQKEAKMRGGELVSLTDSTSKFVSKGGHTFSSYREL